MTRDLNAERAAWFLFQGIQEKGKIKQRKKMKKLNLWDFFYFTE